MRKIYFIIFLICLCCSTLLSAQQTPKFIYNDGYPSIGYLEHLPPGYDTETRDYPVLIFLHGGGEGGDGSPEALEKVKAWGPPRHINSGHDMCFTMNGEKECFIVISPQLIPLLYSWEPYYVNLVVDHVLNGPDQYRVDPKRIYLTGLSRGGHGVYLYASSHLNRPNKLAAIAPMAAWRDQYVDGCTIAERKIPVWAFHGREDTVVPYNDGLAAFNSIKNCKDPEPTAELIFTTYEDRYHDSWIPAYSPDNAFHTPNLYEWLLLQSLDTDADTLVTGFSHNERVAFSIYPNPAQNNIYVSFDEQSWAIKTINIRSMTGALIMKAEDAYHPVDISALPMGVYIVQLTSDAGTIATGRLIKMK